MILGISTVTGACFAVLAGMSLSAVVMPVRAFHPLSIVIAAAAVILGYLAFRSALTGSTGNRSLADSLRNGILGAFAGLLIMFLFLIGFKSGTQDLLAHSLGRPGSTFTINRLLVASVLLGFGTGFVVRRPKERLRGRAEHGRS